MADGLGPAPESWRLVVFTNMPNGMVYSLVDEIVRPLGHRIVGVVTSPGPKRQRCCSHCSPISSSAPGFPEICYEVVTKFLKSLPRTRPSLIQ